MRGTGISLGDTLAPMRITPAHAGNSTQNPSFPPSGRDHPRSCGEQLLTIGNPSISRGSPPLMRGTDVKNYGEFRGYGITPAHAGNSRPLFVLIPFLQDHPRSCGEQIGSAEDNLHLWGSPPLMRGTAVYSTGTLELKRITPAHAGNSFPFLPSVYCC